MKIVGVTGFRGSRSIHFSKIFLSSMKIVGVTGFRGVYVTGFRGLWALKWAWQTLGQSIGIDENNYISVKKLLSSMKIVGVTGFRGLWAFCI